MTRTHRNSCFGHMYKTLFILALVFGLVFIACGGDDYEETPAQITEHNKVELSVASLMADPETPVFDLMTDPRLACGQGGCVMCDETPTVDECTQDMRVLITLSHSPGEGNNQVLPLTEYSGKDIMNNYYCVYSNGAVEGFMRDGTNIDEICFADDGGVTELHSIALAVASLMADPETPVFDLMTDPRVACSAGGCVMCDDDPTINECTQNLRNEPGGLITLSDNPGEGDNQVLPVCEYWSNFTTRYYYCVHPDGEVEGFLCDGSKIKD